MTANLITIADYVDAMEHALQYVSSGVHGYILSKALRQLRPIRDDYLSRKQALVMQFSRPVTDDDSEEIRKAGSRYIDPDKREAFRACMAELNCIEEMVDLVKLPSSIIMQERIPGTLVDRLYDIIDFGEVV